MSPDLELALSLADDADAITLPRFRAHDLRVETKADLTPVSEADRAAEAALRERLARERPGEPVLGEEEGGDDTSGWILDPIDGTRNYTRGIPVWATLIAYADRVAVVSAPALGRRWWAERGAGAFANGEPIRVSAVGGSRTRPSSTGSSGRRLRGRTTPGTCAASATSGRTCSSPRARRTRPSTRPGLEDLGLGADEGDRRGGGRPLRELRLLERRPRRQRAALSRPPRRSGRGRRRRARRRAGRSACGPGPRGGGTGSRPPRRARAATRGGARAARASRGAERSQPARRSASAFGPVTESVFTALTSGQSAASRPRHARLRPQAMSETAIRSKRRCELPVGGGQPAPLGRVDDEPVADVDELLELRLPPRRQPAPAAEGRQVGDQERLHDRAGTQRLLAAEAELDHLRADLTLGAGDREALERDLDADRVGTARVREEQDRARRVQLLEPGQRPARRGRPLRRRPGDVRHHARARPLGMVDAQLGQALLDLGDDAGHQMAAGVRSPVSGRRLAALGRGVGRLRCRWHRCRRGGAKRTGRLEGREATWKPCW